MEKKNEIKIFEERKVRTLWDADQEKWYLPIVDVITLLTDSPNPRKYWSVKTKNEVITEMKYYQEATENPSVQVKKVVSKLNAKQLWLQNKSRPQIKNRKRINDKTRGFTHQQSPRTTTAC